MGRYIMSLYKEFVIIVEEAVQILLSQKNRIKDSLATNRRLEKEFEHHVLLALIGASKGTDFTFDAMESAHAFPDIIAEHKTGVCFGVEVKTAKGWTTNGNSIESSISDSRIEEIIVVFCKTEEPIDIIFKNYEEAISGVQVTHSPRFVLNMASEDKGILVDMGLSYSQFKKLEIKEKIRLVREWYVKKGRDKNKWWIY